MAAAPPAARPSPPKARSPRWVLVSARTRSEPALSAKCTATGSSASCSVDHRVVKHGRAERAWLVPVLLLVAGALISSLAFVWRGHPTSVDFWPHLVRQSIVYNSLRAGTSPFWSFDFYCGFPHLRFYPPLFALLAGTFSLILGGSHVPALKLLLVVLHLMSGLAMFLYLRYRAHSAWAAAIGTLIYLLVPWRILHLAVLANYPQSLIYLLLPLVFYAFDRIRNSGGLRSAVLVGLCLGLMVASHLLYSLFTLVFLAIALLFRPDPSPSPPSVRRSLGLLALGCASALLVSAFFAVPFLAEFPARIYPHADQVLPGPDLLVLVNPWSRPGGYQGAYLGLSTILVALASAVGAVLARDRRARSLWVVVGLGLSVLLVFGTRLLGPIGNRLLFGLPGARFLLFVVFFFGILSAEGVGIIERAARIPAWARVGLLATLVILVGIDCLPHAIGTRNHFSSDRRFVTGKDEIYAAFRQDRPARVLELPGHEDRVDDYQRLDGPPAINFLYGQLPSPFGPPYGQFAPRSMLYVYPWLNSVAVELGDGSDLSLSPAAHRALALSGVSHVITMPTRVEVEGKVLARVKGGINWYTSPVRKQDEPPHILGTTGYPLLLSSTRLLPLEATGNVKARSIMVVSDWRRMLDTLELDTEARSLNVIPVRTGTDEISRGPAGLVVIDQEVRQDRVNVRFQARGECFVRLAVSYYPELRLLLDGRQADFGETADHFIWFCCPEGRHTVSVSAPLGILRQVCAGISLLSILVCAGLLVFRRREADGGPGR